GTDLSKQERHSRLMNESDKFTSEAGESLREWRKYITNVHLSRNLHSDDYDLLFDHLQQYEVNGKAICEDQEDSLTTTMMLLARVITQRYSTPTNNRLCTTLNKRNQAIVQANHVEIQSKNVGNSGWYVRRTTDKAGIILDDEQNDFLLANAFEVEEFEYLNATVCMMAQIQQEGSDYDNGSIYDSDFIGEVNDGQVEQDNNDHDQRHVEIESLIKNVQIEAEKQ
ncbi:hypothetical protein Tco_1026207, partial [Tanacetum coccineum]